MFEFFIAKKYLIPKKKQLSVSLIAIMSIAVISLVVWLVLIFLSVTEGIEKNWLKKLTSLNAPVRINPTGAYYQSYYYQIDSQSSASNYTYKSLAEKYQAKVVDPYDLEEDSELPEDFPKPDLNKDNSVKDLVKELYLCVESLKPEHSNLVMSDYEASCALLRLKLIRPQIKGLTTSNLDSQSFLTQMTYLAPLSPDSTYLHELLIPPTFEDAEHLFYLSSISQKDLLKDEPDRIKTASTETLHKRLENLFSFINIDEVETTDKHFQIPYSYIAEGSKLKVAVYLSQGHISHILIPKDSKSYNANSKTKSSLLSYGILEKKHGKLYFTSQDKTIENYLEGQPLFIEDKLKLKTQLIKPSINEAFHVNDVKFHIEGFVQNQKIQGLTTLKNLKISHINFSKNIGNSSSFYPPWPYHIGNNTSQLFLPYTKDKDHAVILPKNYKDSGVKIGDKGFVSYGVATANAMQEQRLSVYVAGFYDPGIMAVGSKCALMHPDVIHTIASSSQNFALDKNFSSGFQVWFKNLNETKDVKRKLEALLKEKGLDKYFNVTTFYEYDFAKDLLTQFQSDKYLFSIIGIIILIVACSNIISFLILMVNDKKKEIGIMQAMGASKKSLAIIFSSIGITLGFIGSLAGTTLALLTLKNIDHVVAFLSFIQGHDAFNVNFYGDSLPSTLSFNATLFILIATPIVSLLAGLIPAQKACKIEPAQILRSET